MQQYEKKVKKMRQYHTFPPLWTPESKILILGSFPSVKSREQGFFYGHPQNRFWKLMAKLLEEEIPATIEEKKAMLLRHNIALWDVIESCEIEGSSDSSIREVKVNDLGKIVKGSQVRHVFANGGKSYELYVKYGEVLTELPARKLPSTSPANAAFSLERLAKEWGCILECL